MPFTPGPYSGVSTLALVARASAFGVGVVYGTIKLSILKLLAYIGDSFHVVAVCFTTTGVFLSSGSM
ncbi:hypothetical protein PR202_gb27397 [Eleusine coracana subsp. coracana]|uniref:Uncharacterized protein n=1 Tax=Eleusine coracana subsp. coracana TaxID=191504 RepID=A0AAV5FUA9_ELECO|nr:hypothetical protein PR202_gb27397 [Eleusine coracana subsp. coracana]